MVQAKATLLFSILAASLLPSFSQRGLRSVLEWKELEYSFPSSADRQQAISQGLYVHGNGVPIDVDVHYGANNLSRIFVTIPRFTTGIPFTLATATNIKGKDGPLLQAYPDYSWHSSHGEDCMGITSVFRVAIDECERLWVLDTGRIGNVQHCSPQVLIFNLRSNKLIRRYQFPQSQFKIAVSLFVTPIVDVRDPPPRGSCRNTKVYIADVTGFGIVVYDYETNASWRMENKLMFPDPDWGTFTIAGESFDLMDGVLGMSISPQKTGSKNSLNDENEFDKREGRTYHGGGGIFPSSQSNRNNVRYLYFHSLAGAVENRIPLSLADNRTIWIQQSDPRTRDFVTIGTRGTQSAASAMDSRGNMFFGLMEDIAIAAWNINTPYNRNNFKIVANDRTKLQFMSGMKIKRSRINTEELWGLSCRFQKVFSGTKNPQEVNFRIMGCNVDELLNIGCQLNNPKDNLVFRGY